MIDNRNKPPPRQLTRDMRRVAFATALMLLVPLVAMRFTDQVNWSPGDFVAAGVLLGGTGCAYVWLTRQTGRRGRRLATGASLLVALLLVWAELAVGIFGTPIAGS